MASIRKSFNFRNGVQVDNNNFVVNANGLVGIGTSIPTESIDVVGNAKISGLTTTGTLGVAQTANFYNDIKAGSINLDPTSGIITAISFYGDGSTLSNVIAISTTGWIAQGVGLHTLSRSVGIGTTNPLYALQIGEDPTTGTGVGITNGTVTAITFVGSLTGTATTATNLADASNITTGTISNDRLSNVITSDIYSTGISTFTTLKVGTAITMSSGIITATTFSGVASTATKLQNSRDFSVSGDVLSHTVSFDGTGNVALGVTLSSDFSANTTGIITSTGGFYGNLTGIASTATTLENSRNFSVSGDVLSHTVSFNGTSNVALGVTLSSDFSANTTGIITASTLDSTNLTTGSIEVESENSTIEVIGSNSASISIGFTSPTIGIGSTYASLSFSDKDLSIRNYDIGSINSYLQVGGPGLTTGRFNWYDGDTNTLLMALTHEGKLGIGIDNPTETFEVVGTSTVTTDSYVGNDLYVANDLNVTGNINGNFTLPDPITSKVNATGVSTFSSINIFGTGANQLGIGTDDPQYDIDATGKVARFGSVAISTDNAVYNVDVGGGVRATDGFLSYGPNPVQIGIQTVGEGVGLSTYLVFTVVGIGSTSFLLS